MIVGIDEVGRGSLAGPLCMAAVSFPEGFTIEGLADSKKLSALQRQKMAVIIRDHAVHIGIGWVPAEQLDNIGLSAALRLAAEQAYIQAYADGDKVVVDGRDKLLGKVPATYIIKADATIPAVMAASIIAKVARDTYMQRIHQQFKDYNFAQHVGYSTPGHLAALRQFGACAQHRQSFAPVRMLAQ